MTHFDTLGLFEKKFRMYFGNCNLWGSEKDFFSKNLNFFHVIRTWSWIFLDFWLKKVASVAKLPFDVPRGTFWGEQCLYQISFLFFRLRAKNVRTIAKTIDCALLTAYWLSRGTFFQESTGTFWGYRRFTKKLLRQKRSKTAIFWLRFVNYKLHD